MLSVRSLRSNMALQPVPNGHDALCNAVVAVNTDPLSPCHPLPIPHPPESPPSLSGRPCCWINPYMKLSIMLTLQASTQ